jgi:hypothetical protein
MGFRVWAATALAVLTGYLTREWTTHDALIIVSMAFVAGWVIVSALVRKRRTWWRNPNA